jgi:hypothetical protein
MKVQGTSPHSAISVFMSRITLCDNINAGTPSSQDNLAPLFVKKDKKKAGYLKEVNKQALMEELAEV